MINKAFIKTPLWYVKLVLSPSRVSRLCAIPSIRFHTLKCIGHILSPMSPSNETMGYKEIIQRASKEYCRLVAKRIGLPSQLSVQSLREKIPERVLNITWLKERVTRLNPHERSVLTTLTFLSGSHGVPVDLLNQKLKQLCRGWSRVPEQVRQILHESGLVFP